jgi:Xaa-Pro aminopeptidase
LRGSDVSYNPVFVAHLLLGLDGATLFVAKGKISAQQAEVLAREQIAIADYALTRTALAGLHDTSILIDPRRITLGLREALPASARVIEAINPSTMAKSRKTDAEIAQVRKAMELDGAALAVFFAWFESARGHETITEVTIDEQITKARASFAEFVSPSFATIAGFNANGAMPHYRATPESHATIEGDGMLLIDSGGQYRCGTTDITRVVQVGTASAAQRRDFTLVLKGMISLATARFPRGTRSAMLDTLARAPIWAGGVDYGHGTGHGVGYFLNVHEGPQSISPFAPNEPQTAMEPGMITSDEPGIYRPGKWGVRIENLVLARVCESGEFGEFLDFETLTLCPIDTRLVERSMLRGDELAWLNEYHATVLARLRPYCRDEALAWLERFTAAI